MGFGNTIKYNPFNQTFIPQLFVARRIVFMKIKSEPDSMDVPSRRDQTVNLMDNIEGRDQSVRFLFLC